MALEIPLRKSNLGQKSISFTIYLEWIEQWPENFRQCSTHNNKKLVLKKLEWVEHNFNHNFYHYYHYQNFIIIIIATITAVTFWVYNIFFIIVIIIAIVIVTIITIIIVITITIIIVTISIIKVYRGTIKELMI